MTLGVGDGERCRVQGIVGDAECPVRPVMARAGESGHMAEG